MARIGEKQSRRIWALKALAIISVFFAHMPWTNDNPVMRKLFALIGIAGVPIFLFISGYLNYGKDLSIKKKIRTIALPVLIFGSLSYLISTLALGVNIKFNFFIDWLLYLVGSKSIYYFISILFCCFVLSRFVNTWVLISLSILSISFGHDLIPHNEVFTRYLNPFNFILYYELGFIARKYNWQINNITLSIGSGLVLCFASWFLFGKSMPTYFSAYCIIFSIGCFLIFDSILHLLDSNFLVYVGQISFVIYLTHISIAGYINARLQSFWGEHLKIVVAFTIVLSIVWFFDYMTSKIELLRRYRPILGYRKTV